MWWNNFALLILLIFTEYSFKFFNSRYIIFCRLNERDNFNKLSYHSFSEFIGLPIHQGDTSTQLPLHILYVNMPPRKMPQMPQYHFLP